MKEWFFYCILLSLIYAVAVHAATPAMTAQLVHPDGRTVAVLDCALFMPNLGAETNEVVNNLAKLGYSPQISNKIFVKRTDFADSNGHSVLEYSTEFSRELGNYGKGTLLMSVSGYEIGRSKKRAMSLNLQRLGHTSVVGASRFVGILSERRFSVQGMPRCMPAQRRR